MGMIYEFICKRCGKRIDDVNEQRYKYNVEQHELKHIRQDERKRRTEQE